MESAMMTESSSVYPDSIPEADSWCFYSEIPQVRLNCGWNIKNFSRLDLQPGEKIDSVPFSGKYGDTNWCLRLYPKGVDTSSRDFLSLFLVLTSGSRVNAMFTFSVAGKNRQKEFIYESGTFQPFDVADDSPGYKTNCHGNIFFIESDVLLFHKLFLFNDCLTIICDVTIVASDGQVCDIDFPRNLATDLGQLLLDKQQHCDVILSVRDQKLHVHKAVLAARSPVFSAMFTKDVKDNVVEISDMSYEAVVQMVRFVYTGRVLDLTNINQGQLTDEATAVVAELLAAAEKYRVEDLMSLCERALCSNLRVETAAEVLILAELHKANALKRKAVNFIKCHKQEVKNTDGWKRMSESHANVMLVSFF